MEWYETKKALLERLGKNPKDNKLVDRMLLDWRVELREWMYYIVDKDSIIHELEEEIKRLKSEPKQVVESDSWEVQKLREELEEAKINCDYYKKLANKYWRYCSDIMGICYKKVKSVMWSRYTETEEEFKEGIANMIKEPTE